MPRVHAAPSRCVQVVMQIYEECDVVRQHAATCDSLDSDYVAILGPELGLYDDVLVRQSLAILCIMLSSA